MTKEQKQYAIAAAAALALLLGVLYVRSRQGSSAAVSGGTASPDTSASDYAALAGQEQGDVAGLQQQNTQLNSQETSDVAALQAQEGQDVTGLTQAVAGITSAVDTATTAVSNMAAAQTTAQGQLASLGQNVAALASGQAKVNRQLTATLPTHVGGPFYKYYKQITGKAPPANIATSNFIYQAWKNGVSASAFKNTTSHPSAPKQKQVAHPNPGHTPRTAQRPSSPKLPQPKPAPKASKPKVSGRRK